MAETSVVSGEALVRRRNIALLAILSTDSLALPALSGHAKDRADMSRCGHYQQGSKADSDSRYGHRRHGSDSPDKDAASTDVRADRLHHHCVGQRL